MKLSEYKEDYYTFTGKLSDINRQIAFAGIALIWIFKKGDADKITLCHDLIVPAILLAIALGSDIMQYIYQSIIWAIFYRYHERKANNEDVEVSAPSILNYPSWFFFIVKVLLVIIAYGYIIDFLMRNVTE